MRALRAAMLIAIVGAGAACARPLRQEELSDAALKARLQAALAGHNELELRYVTIDVDAGVITLSGIASSIEQRRVLGNLAARVRGAEQVLNNLLVQE